MYFSILNTLKTCTKILENLEALKLLLETSDEDYSFFVERKESNIKNEDLRCFLLLNSFSISDLVIKTNENIKSICGNIPDSLDKVDIDLSKHDTLWKKFLRDREEKNIFIEMSEDILKVSVVCKSWLKYLQEEEDRGTESSYSDYSGDSTETSDNEEHEEDEEDESSE